MTDKSPSYFRGRENLSAEKRTDIIGDLERLILSTTVASALMYLRLHKVNCP